MFGRKAVSAPPQSFIKDPNRSYNEADGNMRRGTDDAVSVMSQAFGFDLDFQTAYIFSPSHWQIPEVGKMLSQAGMESNMKGNLIQLLRSPASVAKLNSIPANSPIRAALEKSGFGSVLYDPDVENGFSDEFSKMQAQTLKNLAAEYQDPKARQRAVFDFHRWSSEVMKGRGNI